MSESAKTNPDDALEGLSVESDITNVPKKAIQSDLPATTIRAKIVLEKTPEVMKILKHVPTVAPSA